MSQDTVISISGLDKQVVPFPDELIDGAITRPVFQRVTMHPRISLNGILLSLLCTLLLVFIGFIMVSLPSGLDLGKLNTPAPVQMIRYTFLLPVALLIAAFLGPVMGTASILLYVLTGLFLWPVFANGGGPAYVLEPSFGYLAGLVFTGFLLGKNFYRAFKKQNSASRSLKILGFAVGSVLFVHGLGVAYLALLAILGQVPLAEVPGWVLRLSVESLPYDLLATTVFLCLVRQIRLGLWLVLY